MTGDSFRSTINRILKKHIILPSAQRLITIAAGHSPEIHPEVRDTDGILVYDNNWDVSKRKASVDFLARGFHNITYGNDASYYRVVGKVTYERFIILKESYFSFQLYEEKETRLVILDTGGVILAVRIMLKSPNMFSVSLELGIKYELISAQSDKELIRTIINHLKPFLNYESEFGARSFEFSTPGVTVNGHLSFEHVMALAYDGTEGKFPGISPPGVGHSIKLEKAIQKLPDIISNAMSSKPYKALASLREYCGNRNFFSDNTYYTGVCIGGQSWGRPRLEEEETEFFDLTGGMYRNKVVQVCNGMMGGPMSTLTRSAMSIYDALLCSGKPVSVIVHFDEINIMRVDNKNVSPIPMGNYIVIYTLSPRGNTSICAMTKSSSCGTYLARPGGVGYSHPHITGDHICTGGYGSLIASALSNGDIPSAVELTRNMLESVNTRSVYHAFERMLMDKGMCKEAVSLCIAEADNRSRLDTLVFHGIRHSRNRHRFLSEIKDLEDCEQKTRIIKSCKRMNPQVGISGLNELLGEPVGMEDIFYRMERYARGGEYSENDIHPSERQNDQQPAENITYNIEEDTEIPAREGQEIAF